MCLQAQDDNDFPEIIHTSRNAIYALLIMIKAHTIVQTMWEECFALEIITHNQRKPFIPATKYEFISKKYLLTTNTGLIMGLYLSKFNLI